MPDAGTGGSNGTPAGNDPARIEAEIEEHRAQLAATVDELGAKVAQQKAEAKDVGMKAGAALGGLLVVVLLVKLVKSRRR